MSGISSVSGRSDIAQVLADMKNVRAQIQRPETIGTETAPGKINTTTQTSETPKFGDLLSNAVNSVNDTQMKSATMSKAYEQGDPSVSLTQVMIQSQKASVSFQALTQVRNKVVKAYEDIMNMPV
jgi:flagellar hook-basal body complex protein FliE